MRTLSVLFIPLFLVACAKDAVDKIVDDLDSDDTEGSEGTEDDVCDEPIERPHPEGSPVWTYHLSESGPDKWGTLTTYETCSEGLEQSPINIVTGTTVFGAPSLVFAGYDKLIPLGVYNNGHTLQVNYAGTKAPTDPQITIEGKTFYLIQFHFHSTSEHTINGVSSPLELHLVHKSDDSLLAVVGLLFDGGEESPLLETLFERNPGHELEATCADTVSLDVVPTDSAYYAYAGSLTTPTCAEAVAWIVLAEHAEASAAQATEWAAEFGGTTNRPVQPLNGRDVFDSAAIPF